MGYFNGLNGTIMLNTSREGLRVGTAPGEPYGYDQPLTVRAEIRVERLERRDVYDTIEHEQIVRPYGLSVTTWVSSPGADDMIAGGATRDPLREVTQPTRFFTRETLTKLADLADRWHVNDMQAACAHQTVIGDTVGERLDRTEPCPITQYRYGSQWLVEPLPAQVLHDLMALLDGPIGNRNIYVHPDFNL